MMASRQARPRSLADRIPRPVRDRITRVRVAVGIALAGSLIFVFWGLIDRSGTQVPILVSGLLILGLTFAALAVTGAIGAYRAGVDGEGARAFWAALVGGLAVLLAFGCLTAAVLLALLWGR